MYFRSIDKTRVINVDPKFKGVKGVRLNYLIPAESGSPIELRYVEVKPGGVTPHEMHIWYHLVFVTKGEGYSLNGSTGEEMKVKAGDAFYIYPNEVHRLRNPGKEPFCFICMIPAGAEDFLRDDLEEKKKELGIVH